MIAIDNYKNQKLFYCKKTKKIFIGKENKRFIKNKKLIIQKNKRIKIKKLYYFKKIVYNSNMFKPTGLYS